MTRTENYQLPQWEAHDPLRRGDFNEAMESLDSGLQAAQTTADAAQAAAKVAYTPDNMPYVAGVYTGNNGTKTIKLGFCPSFLIISGDLGSGTSSNHYQQYGNYLGFMSKDFTYSTVTWTDTGFQIVRSSDSYPLLNENQMQYRYIAFR